jgi:UDPglucose--hexose-1-phosphate uridylyltransferase
MPELRQDMATREWIVMATERARRPHDFRVKRSRADLALSGDPCPFCPGHEGSTPPEVMAHRRVGEANGPGWWIRVVPNKFAALIPEGSLERNPEEGFFRKTDGVGRHEVVIESPCHDLCIPLMDDWQVEEILWAYRERFLALQNDPRVRLIIIFKNHGLGAGTSVQHSHSQIIATSVFPLNVRNKLYEAARYHDENGRCVYCDMLNEELRAGKRIVQETDAFVVYHPFASRAPFETWIVPKAHEACFALISPDDLKRLAHALRAAWVKLHEALNDPDLNYVLHSTRSAHEGREYYHWHLQIIPRLTTPAGFELGSGMYINTALPEETAAFLRGMRL